MHKPQINLNSVKKALRVKFSNNFRRFKINPDKTIDVESSTCYFLGVPEIPSDSFRSATRFPTILGQYLCLIPMSQDEFRLYSVRTALSVIALLCQIAMTVLSFCWLKESGANIFKGGAERWWRSHNVYNVLSRRLPRLQVWYYSSAVRLWPWRCSSICRSTGAGCWKNGNRWKGTSATRRTWSWNLLLYPFCVSYFPWVSTTTVDASGLHCWHERQERDASA